MVKKDISDSEYSSIHSWLKYHYGVAVRCYNKKCKGLSKNFHWALKKGKRYQKDRKSFIMLCVSCHGVYDTTPQKRLKMRELNKNTHATHCLEGHALTGDNVWFRKRKTSIERHCRICKNKRARAWRKGHKEHYLIYQRAWRNRRKLSTLSEIK